MTTAFDKIAFQYDQNQGGERFANAFLPLIDSKKKILDFGAGTGVLAGALEKKGCDVIGFDASAELLEHATGTVNTLVWSDMNTLPFLDGYFGTVYSVWSLHLVNDVASSLHDIRRVLDDEGCLINCSAANILTSPPSDQAGEILIQMQSSLHDQQEWHDKPEDLERVCNEAGLKYEATLELSHTYKTSVAQTINQIENNGMQILQTATEEQRQQVIEPALEELRNLPDHDALISRERAHRLSILRAA